MIIIILGPSGSGKDTQAQLISQKYGFSVTGTGDLFRYEINKGTKIGKVAYKYVKKGIWVPIEYWGKIIKSWMKRTDITKNHLLIGFIRINGQQQIFDRLLDDLGSKVDAVLHIGLSVEEAVERLSKRWFCKACGETYDQVNKPPKVAGACDKEGSPLVQREDDKPESIKQRMNEYLENIEPILNYYRKRGILKEINGAQSISNVFKDINQILSEMI